MVTNKVTFKSCIINGKCLEENQVIAKIGREGQYDRKHHDKYENTIEDIWIEKLHNNPKLFNAPKFRLHSYSLNTETNHLYLEIGLTCYKDYLGTNHSSYLKNFQEDGLRRFGNSQCYLSESLGVGGLVITTDNKFVILHRSQYVSEAQGLLDRPGGHPEPENIPEFSIENGLTKVEEKYIVKELFKSIIDEIVDEVNIPEIFLVSNNLMGFSINNTNGGRAVAEFILKCNLSSDEVIFRYTTGGHKEADESTSVYCWTEQELISAATSPDAEATMSLALIGAIQLYQQYKF